jgi:ribonuclease VapC
VWEIELMPFDAKQAAVASRAYRDFGRGSGHPAGLNLGDCFSYALANVVGEPLLFAGDDFVHTDVIPAYVPPSLTNHAESA